MSTDSKLAAALNDLDIASALIAAANMALEAYSVDVDPIYAVLSAIEVRLAGARSRIEKVRAIRKGKREVGTMLARSSLQ